MAIRCRDHGWRTFGNSPRVGSHRGGNGRVASKSIGSDGKSLMPFDALIPVQTQFNADKSLAYIKYKYKGSTVKIDYSFDSTGKLIAVGIPQFLNLPHLKVFEIISGMFIQSVINIPPTTVNLTLPTSTTFTPFQATVLAGFGAVAWTPAVGKKTQVLHLNIHVKYFGASNNECWLQDGDGTLLFYGLLIGDGVTDNISALIRMDITLPGAGKTCSIAGTSVEFFLGGLEAGSSCYVWGTIDGNEV